MMEMNKRAHARSVRKQSVFGQTQIGKLWYIHKIMEKREVLRKFHDFFIASLLFFTFCLFLELEFI